MRDKERKPAQLTNLQWLQRKAPWKYKERNRSVLVQDPSSLLFEDTWMLADCSLREPITRLELSGLSWPCALAWLCARETKFVEDLDQTLRQQALSLSAASTLLSERLSSRFHKPPNLAKQAVSLAESLLIDVLSSGAIAASGKQATTPIDQYAWMYFEKGGETAHDSFVDWRDESITFVDVQIDDIALLRRWEERPSARLLKLRKPIWNLPETLYWYARGTHANYEGEKTLPCDEATAARDNLDRDLRTGTLRVRASLRANVPGASANHLEVTARDISFWRTFSVGEVAVAEFEADAIQKKVPAKVDLSRSTSRREAEVVLMTEHKMTSKEARAHLARIQFAKAKPGPKPKSR